MRFKMKAADIADCCRDGPGVPLVVLVVGVISAGEAVPPRSGDVADELRETNRLDMVDLQPVAVPALALGVVFA